MTIRHPHRVPSRDTCAFAHACLVRRAMDESPENAGVPAPGVHPRAPARSGGAPTRSETLTSVVHRSIARCNLLHRHPEMHCSVAQRKSGRLLTGVRIGSIPIAAAKFFRPCGSMVERLFRTQEGSVRFRTGAPCPRRLRVRRPAFQAGDVGCESHRGRLGALDTLGRELVW